MSNATNEALSDLHSWAQKHIDQPVMFDYILHRVNNQIPNTLFILLRQSQSKVPNVELEITYYPDREYAYWAIFSALPFHVKMPYPDLLRPQFHSQPEVIQWLKTGNQRPQFYSF